MTRMLTWWSAPVWVALMIGLCLAPSYSGSLAFAQDDAATVASAPDVTAPAEADAPAEEESAPDTPEAVRSDADALWTCLAAFLVFFMQAGFALVECGFTRAKNACNIIMKNLMDFSLGGIIYWAVGFGLMFGAVQAGVIGSSFFFFDANAPGTAFADGAAATETAGKFGWAFILFQTVFAATAATIVSGAMAERTKFTSYLIYTVVITAFVYPVFGCWAWNSLVPSTGAGWLSDMGFLDFAGSTVVHSIGGWAALAGAIVLGPRIGKYAKDGKINPIPGHNIPMGALGVFILWFGWFGFNPGSTTAIGGSYDLAEIAFVTNLAACAGAVGAMVMSWILFKKPDPSLTLNGALAGLVTITAGCDCIDAPFAVLAGLIGGVLVVLSILMFDKIRVDDPVGAVSVHGVCGAWGTLAVGLFHRDMGLVLSGDIGQTITQLIGIGSAFGWSFGLSMILFLAIKFTVGLRVGREEEIEGLDIIEHGMYAYPPSMVVDESMTGSTAGHKSALVGA